MSVTAARQSLAQGVKQAYQQHVGYRKEPALLPVHNVVTKSGLHIHPFAWGIFLLLGVGFLGLVLEQASWHPRLGIVFGVLLGLYYAANHFWNQVVREAGIAFSILRRGEERFRRVHQGKPPSTGHQ